MLKSSSTWVEIRYSLTEKWDSLMFPIIDQRLKSRIKPTVFTFWFTNKARTPHQYIPWISIPFTLIKNWTFSRGKVCHNSFGNFFDCHRPHAKGQPLQEHLGVSTVFLVNVLQNSVIGFIKTLWKFRKLLIYFISAQTFLQLREL